MLTKCTKCDFNINHTDEFCLNCGTNHPTKEIKLSDSAKLILTLIKMLPFKIFISFFLTFILLFAIADGELSGIFYLRNYILIVCFISSLAISFTLFPIIEKWYRKNIRIERFIIKNNFISLEKLIEKRLSDLNRRRQRINVVLDRIKQDDSSKLQNTRKTLLSAHDIVTCQHARYELHGQKIKILRLQNSALPFQENIHRLNTFQMDVGLITIDNTKIEVEKIRQKLSLSIAIEVPKSLQAEKESFLSELDETERSCDNLREALLTKQATRALQGISPLEMNLDESISKEIDHAVATFNIHSSLTDFSDTFDELEVEYRRFQAEGDLESRLKSLTSNIPKRRS